MGTPPPMGKQRRGNRHIPTNTAPVHESKSVSLQPSAALFWWPMPLTCKKRWVQRNVGQRDEERSVARDEKVHRFGRIPRLVENQHLSHIETRPVLLRQ